VTATDANHSNVTSTSVTSTVVVSNGKILYNNNSTTPQFGIYTNSTNTFSAGTATLTNAVPTFMIDKASSLRNEHIAGYLSTNGTDGVLYVMRWDGNVWTDEWNVSIPGYTGLNGRPFDIDYRGNDTAIVAYSLGTGNAQKFAYQIWDGTSWTAPATVTMAQLNATGIIRTIKIASKSSGSACTVVAQDSSNYLSAVVYTSPAFGNERQLSTTAYRNTSAGDVPAFDLAYETTSQDLLVVNTQGTTINYWTLVGTTWNNPTALAIGSTTGAILAVADPNAGSNNILVAGTRANTAGTMYVQVWNGAAFSTTNSSNSMGSILAVNKMPLSGGFVKSGTTTAAVLAYNGGTDIYIPPLPTAQLGQRGQRQLRQLPLVTQPRRG